MHVAQLARAHDVLMLHLNIYWMAVSWLMAMFHLVEQSALDQEIEGKSLALGKSKNFTANNVVFLNQLPSLVERGLISGWRA